MVSWKFKGMMLGLCGIVGSPLLFATKFQVKVFNVGQGNGILVTAEEEQMVVDFGSTAYTKEWKIRLKDDNSSSDGSQSSQDRPFRHKTCFLSKPKYRNQSLNPPLKS
ncbi:MAG: hypothetical protein ACRCYZ_04915 [Alphaproteobacteria bacterium]